MRKWFIIPIMLLAIFFISDKTRADYKGILLGESDLYSTIQLRADGLLKEIVVLPQNDYNHNEAKAIIHRLDQLPKSILQKTVHQHIKIILFNGKLTDHDRVPFLQGEIPRGYTEPVVWDDVPGIGGTELVYVKIGHSERGKGHGSVNLEYHELAHSLMNLVYNDTIVSDEISNLWSVEAESIFPRNQYFLNYKEEYFAECFAYYFFSPETRKVLQQKAPKTYEFFNKL
ncbi:Pro-Pro endopeptidase [Bacillus sp. J14TS2]|uniref:anthrax toxin lethal factor-related metalloendopeptidase n=1 Tax=Bacillus sp. J14TS2 TaxID=2807188 RepID=UPI001B0D4AE8|nr:toxin [Bacillus sp. J14TS2]GIN70125.1 Pro-Pro endopeptidase [Bacillus sp. J14TS2]